MAIVSHRPLKVKYKKGKHFVSVVYDTKIQNVWEMLTLNGQFVVESSRLIILHWDTYKKRWVK